MNEVLPCKEALFSLVFHQSTFSILPFEPVIDVPKLQIYSTAYNTLCSQSCYQGFGVTLLTSRAVGKQLKRLILIIEQLLHLLTGTLGPILYITARLPTCRACLPFYPFFDLHAFTLFCKKYTEFLLLNSFKAFITFSKEDKKAKRLKSLYLKGYFTLKYFQTLTMHALQPMCSDSNCLRVGCYLAKF